STGVSSRALLSGISGVQAGAQAPGEDGDVGLRHPGDVVTRQLTELPRPRRHPAPTEIASEARIEIRAGGPEQAHRPGIGLRPIAPKGAARGLGTPAQT